MIGLDMSFLRNKLFFSEKSFAFCLHPFPRNSIDQQKLKTDPNCEIYQGWIQSSSSDFQKSLKVFEICVSNLKKVSDNKLSDNNLAFELVGDRRFFKPITIEEIVMFMIRKVYRPLLVVPSIATYC